MKDFFKNNYSFIAGSVLVFAIIFSSGFYLGKQFIPEVARVSLANTAQASSTNIDFAPFWKAWNIVNEKYMPTGSSTKVKVDDEKKVYGAISGMVASLGDPYTVFFPPVESKSFADEVRGNFEGVGMEVDIRDGVLTVISPLKGTPAYNAGIKAGDKILAVNKKSTDKLSTEEAIILIKGKKGTEVTFLILREGTKEPFEKTVIRDVINIPTIDTEIKKDVFIIRLYSFTSTSPDLFRGALREFIESGKTKMIIDLRGNPGGYLEAALDMASWFLPAGKLVVKEDARDPNKTQDFRSRGYDIFNSNLKLAILIDRGSASASEILAGALKENGKAILVGTTSYGKGSVQELIDITDDTSLKITIARWLTPNGHSLSDGGLVPDIEVPFDPEKYLKEKVDNQLERAVEELNK